MSIDTVKLFNQRLITDEAVRTAFSQFELSDVDGVRAYAAQLGYFFSEQDLIDAATELGVLNDELTDEQIDAVAGGTLRTEDVLSNTFTQNIGVAVFAKVIKR